jgi:GT2 family glycosyltransferase
MKENILPEMINWMDKNPNSGIVTCMLKNSDNTLQGTGGYFPTLFRVFAWMFFLDDIPVLDSLIKPFHPYHSKSLFYRGLGHYLSNRKLDWVTGAFMLFRKQALQKVGGFDEDYFMYTEDTDICYRIKKNGWQIWYLPAFSVVHFGGSSSNSEFPIVSEFQGIKIFYKKHYPKWQFLVLRLLLKLGALVRIIVFGLLKGREATLAYAKAFSIS